MKRCITNARYLGNNVDLFVNDTVIENMTPAGHHSPTSEHDVFDAQGMVLFPSFIDAHTHLREPGQEYKEDVASGLAAAAHGGFGAIMCMANTSPVNDCAPITRFILEAARTAFPHGPYVYPVGAATLGLKGEAMAPLSELADAGCVAFSNDGRSMENAELMRRIMEYASDLDRIVIDHCEDFSLAKGAHMNEGLTSGRIGIKGQPDIGEAMQVARDILLAEYLHLPVHIAHVSCKRAVDLIAWGKSRGVRVTAETCPHYLLLDDTALENYGTNAKVNPPLRTQEDIAALRQAVKDGTIDILVTDHAPHADHEKECPLDEAPNGLTGLDLAVSLTWSLVKEGILSEADMERLWSREPGRIFSLPVNMFAPGDPANFFLFDPDTSWLVSSENIHSKSCNTPFAGQTLYGQVKAHWIGGYRVV